MLSAEFTWARVPVTVIEVVPEPVTPVPVAVRVPAVSATVAVKVSPLTTPLSDRLTPGIEATWPTPRVSDPGAEKVGGPATVTLKLCWPASPPRLSVALRTTVSVPIVPS